MTFMCAIASHITLFFALGVPAVQTLTLLQTNILVEEGGSYIQRVTDADLHISRCTANFSVYSPMEDPSVIQVVVELDLHSSDATFPEDFEDTTNLKSRLHSIGSELCGCKLNKVSLEDPTKWTIEVTSESETQSATFSVGVYESIKLHSVQEASLGSSLYVTCGTGTTSSPTYCYMYNPAGEVVYRGTGCSYSTTASAAEDLGIWRCVVGATPYIEPLEFTVEVIAADTIIPEKWVNETNDYVSFGCKISDCCTRTPDHCIITSPGGERILIRPGSASVRYTSLYTNLKEYVCAIEIQKPLLDSERGAWTCEINDRGVFLLVDKITDVKDRTFSSSTVTELGKPFQVNCKLPYATSYCFITSPTGERHNPKYVTRSELGECSYDVSSAQSEHNGTWTCSFFREDDIVAIEEKFEVFVRNALKCSLDVSASKGGEATMFCNTGRAPLEYCWFTSPTGKTYQLKDGAETTEVSYVGKGLESGDCGIKIRNAQDEDLGNWTCIMKIGTTEKVYTITLNLSTSIVPLAAGLGAAAGVILVVLSVGGVLLYRRYRRQRQLNVTGGVPEPNEQS